MSGETNKDNLQNDELIEQDFNDALTDLQKSLEPDEKTDELQKAKGDKSPEVEEDEDKGEEEEEEEQYTKSIADILDEDPDASVAIDVEPFLRQLVKAVDESIAELIKSVGKRMGTLEKLVKSQSAVLLQTAKLEKSISDTIQAIGGQPVPSNSIRTLAKSRFGNEESAPEYSNMDVLAKSRDWVKNQKISLIDAGKIEGRINKGKLGTFGDRLDQKVAELMKEGK